MTPFKTIIGTGVAAKKTTIGSGYTPFRTIVHQVVAQPPGQMLATCSFYFSGTAGLRATGKIIASAGNISIITSARLLGTSLTAPSGSIEITGTATMKAIALMVANSEAAFSGSAILVGVSPGSGIIVANAAISIDGGCTIIAVGLMVPSASMSITGTATMANTGYMIAVATMSVSGTASVVAIGLMAATSAAEISTTANVIGIGLMVGSASMSITGDVAVKAIGLMVGSSSASIVGSVVLKATGKIIATATAQITTVAALKATGLILGNGTASITASGTLTAAGAAVFGLPSTSGIATNPSQSLYPALWQGLVGLWSPSVGVQANILRDLSGRRNDGTLTNFAGGISATSGYFPGKKGMSLMFDGTNDYVDMGIKSDFDFPNKQFTLMLWYFHNSTTDRGLISKFGTGFRGYMIWNGGGGSNIDLYIDGGEVTVGAGAVVVGNWHHLAFTWDGSTVRAYKDGLLQNSAGWSSIPESEGGPFVLGRYAGGSYMNGGLDDVRIYNRSLTPAEVKQCYSGASPLTRKQY